VPDGLASGILAGVNPVAGLYAYVFGTLGVALTTSSTFMTVQAQPCAARTTTPRPGSRATPARREANDDLPRLVTSLGRVD
jgi:SulP family sulfate permease